MRRLSLVVVLFMLAVPCLAFGQAQTAPPPKPGPEVQQLAAWQGTWQCSGESKTGTQTRSEFSLACEWAAGGFFLVCKSASKTAEWTGIWGYNPEAKAYFGFRYYSDGWTDFPKGWLNGKTWTFVFEDEHRGGKAQRRQVTEVVESPTVLTFQWDRSVEGAPWTTTAVGRCSKVK